MAIKSDFNPIRQLWNSQADLSLFFLSARGIEFAKETDDPWYSAHKKITRQNLLVLTNGETQDIYFADDVASVVGCVAQNQLCNPALPKGQRCTPFMSVEDVWSNALNMWPEWNKLSSLEQILKNFDPSNIPVSLGSASLTARYGLLTGTQGPLPSNQWQLEIEHWFKAALAYLQTIQVDYATSPSDPSMRKFIRPQQDSDGSRYFCQNQVSNPSHVIHRL